jgi:hypothetical protein
MIEEELGAAGVSVTDPEAVRFSGEPDRPVTLR